MEILSHSENLYGSTPKSKGSVENGAEPVSTAPQSGTSTPDTSNSPEEAEGPGPDEKYFSGIVYATETDTETGEVTKYRRPCTKVANPQTGTPNERFRKSFCAHAAWVARRREYGKGDVFHVTVTLHEEDLAEANLSAEETKSVFAQLTPRLKKRLHRKDEEAEALLSHAPRPNGGEWHVHVLVFSKGCTLEEIRDVFRVDGTNTRTTTPFSNADTADGEEIEAERFATATASYLFKNRVEGAKRGDSGGFSSWKKKGGNAATDGVGYTSMAAKNNRRRYAEAQSSPEGGNGGEETGEEGSNTGAGSKTENQTDTAEEEGNNGGSLASDNGNGGESATGTDGVTGESADTATEETGNDEEKGRAPPVSVANDTVGTWRVARRLVLSALSARLNTEVQVENVGRARLTWVEVSGNGGVVCTVRPLEKWDDGREKVGWRKIERDGAPIVRQTNPNAMNDNAEEDTADTGTKDYTEEAEAYWENARHQTDEAVLPNGNVHVREWRDGKVVRDEEVPQ